MPVKVNAGALSGVDAIAVSVEVEIDNGKPDFTIIGLGDSAIKESRERVRCAIRQAGFRIPEKILVSLAPAEIKKEGSAFDLAIALGILAADGQIDFKLLQGYAFYGELSLDGLLKPIRGAIALAVNAVLSKLDGIIVPAFNESEAALISGLDVVGANSLLQVIKYLREGIVPENKRDLSFQRVDSLGKPKLLSEVWGQEAAKRAMIIAAAGNHNLLMIGPPGCGKSMLAERFPSILPPLTPDEMLETVKVHSAMGLPVSGLLSGLRPYRNPHYIISDAGLVGGGSNPRPGEVTLAHRGVLFLDELPEFRRSVIEALRIPLESGVISVARAKGSVKFPANFQLIAAMNPCPCGRLGSGENGGQPCSCSRQSIHQYLRKLSQPILDRIDLHVELNPVPVAILTSKQEEKEQLQDITREQICNIQFMQRERNGGKLNAQLGSEEMKRIIRFKGKSLSLLERAAEKNGLSARGYMRVIKVAQTIADLTREEAISEQHVAEAIGLRSFERLKRYVEGR